MRSFIPAPGPVQNIDVAMSVDNKVEAKLAWTAPVTNWCTGTANQYIVQKRIASHDEEKDRNIPYKKVCPSLLMSAHCVLCMRTTDCTYVRMYIQRQYYSTG